MENPEPSQKLRREVWWHDLGATNYSLKSVGRCFEDRLDRSLLSSSNPLLRHIRSPKEDDLRRNLHKCPGYLCEVITLTCDLSKSAIVSHAFPGPSERCSICHWLDQYTYSESFDNSVISEIERIPAMNCLHHLFPAFVDDLQTRGLSGAELVRKLSSEVNGRSTRTGGKISGGSTATRKKGPRAKRTQSAATVDSDSNEVGKRKKFSSGGKTEAKKFAPRWVSVSHQAFTFTFINVPLAAVLQFDKLSRPQVVKHLWDYIKRNESQIPKTDGRSFAILVLEQSLSLTKSTCSKWTNL